MKTAGRKDDGHRNALAIAILTLVVLILIDWSWYRSYYLNQVVRTIRLLTG